MESVEVSVAGTAHGVIGDGGREAYLVRPRSREPVQAAVLWLHWLGDERSDRSQFLAEAIELAQMGCVSLLPAGHFPWQQDPDGTVADARLVRGELAILSAAVESLLKAAGVDHSRLAVVGHDYGAMYALAAGGFGARAVVAIAPDQCWSGWFTRYWLGGQEPTSDYVESFADLRPTSGAVACQDRLLLQWAGRDEYVPPTVPAEYAAAAPRASVFTYPDRDHRVGGSAPARDRRTFLAQHLGGSMGW